MQAFCLNRASLATLHPSQRRLLRTATSQSSSSLLACSRTPQSSRCCPYQLLSRQVTTTTATLYPRGNLLYYRNNEISRSRNNWLTPPQVRYFESESDYHNVADETLETIQDSVEELMEKEGIEAEINLASGVLTMKFPQGTYVLNKQTPNRQIWWSSFVSGPRRYEYDEAEGKWIFTREESITLGDSLKEEFQELFNLELELDV